MDPDRWRRVQELFDRALAVPEADRRPFVERESSGDEDLRHHVESLLEADVQGQGFLEGALQEGLDLLQETAGSPRERREFGKYLVLEEIGAGGFGKVYRGHDPHLEREVAIKTCSAGDADLRRRFFREARISAGLQHPKIVTVHDFGEADGLPFLVQELLDGEDLDRLIARREEMTLDRKVDVLLQISRGLAYAHDQGVLHRDVKPSNIRVLGDGGIKILDFGIACLLNGEHRLTRERVTVGTVSYIAPEQLQAAHLDERSDIFSFGVLAYELLVLERPFVGEAFAEIAHQILHREPEPLLQRDPSLPRALALCVHRCLAKDPDRRFPSFAQVVSHLEGITESGFADPPGTVRRRWRGPAAAVAAGGAVLAAVLLWPPRAEPPPPAAGAAREAGNSAGERPRSLPPPEPSAELTAPLRDAQPPAPAEPSPPPPSADGEAPGPRTVPASSAAEAGRSKAGRSEAGRSEAGSAAPELSVEEGPSHSVPSPGPSVGELPDPGASVPSPAVRAATDRPPADGAAGAAAGEAWAGELPADGDSAPETSSVGNEDPKAPSEPAPSEPAPFKPVLRSRPEPRYPPLAQRRQKEADVTVAVLVDAGGRVRRTLVLRSNDPGLGFEEAALEAAREALFEPARIEGEPVQEWTELVFEFRLP